MAGIISLSHPVPSTNTDDFHVDSDSNDNNLIPTTKTPKQTKNNQPLPHLKSTSSQTSINEKHIDKNAHNDANKTPKLPSFHGLRPCYPPSIYKKDYKNVLKEIIAGIIVSFAQVPESISFAMLASLPAIFGLHSAWLIGGLVTLTGGRPGMISGATGGMGAILSPIMKDPNLGINYLPYTIMFSGVLITICGLCGIAKFARLIPQPVMIGFLNGLAIIIFKSQVHLFHHAHGWEDYLAAGLLAILTFLVVQFLPKLTKLIPSSLAAIVVATGIEYLIIRMAIGHHTPLIGEMSEIAGDWPQPFWHAVYDQHEYFTHLPSLNSVETWSKLITPVVLVTLVSIIEDAMTMDVVTELTHTKMMHLPRHTKQQQVAMGIANVIGGLLSTMGGHGAIGLSMVSCHSGSTGVYRISGIIACVLVFIIVMFAAPVIDAIPYAALVGIMLAVVGHTFEWKSIPMVVSSFLPRKLRRKLPSCMRETKIRRGDAIVIVIVTTIVVTVNLAYAVLLGIIIQSLIYTWYSGFSFHVHKEYVHIHHMRDRRHIRKFSDFHIHYHAKSSRENSMETIDTLDPHFRDHHPVEANDHHEHHHDHHGNELVRIGSFTELHEIRDIHHLDTFMSGVHMQSLKEADISDDDHIAAATATAKVELKDLEHIKSINDTFKTDKTDKSGETDDKTKKIPTFEIHNIEHGTLRKFNSLDDDSHNGHKHSYKPLSDCTNPEDIESFAGFVTPTFNNDYILVYHFEGPLFFGNCRNLLGFFDPKNDPEHIEIHLRDACIYDFSAMNALNQVGAEYDNLGKSVHLRHINAKSHKLIAKANHLVKYFSYDDVIAPSDPKNKNKINPYMNSENSVTGNNERETSKSTSLLQLGAPNQYRFRMNTRHV